MLAIDPLDVAEEVERELFDGVDVRGGVAGVARGVLDEDALAGAGDVPARGGRRRC